MFKKSIRVLEYSKYDARMDVHEWRKYLKPQYRIL